MDAPLLFGLGHSLHAVYSAFILHLAVNPAALDQRYDFFDAADPGFTLKSPNMTDLS